jgi:hypothetical protein
VKINETQQWQKSSYCGTNACVEVSVSADGVLVRDSRSPEAAPLSFTVEEWTAFVQGIKAGEFGT